LSLAFNPDGKTIAAGFGVAGGVVLWDLATLKRLAQDPLLVREGDVNSVAFSPDGKTIATGFHHISGPDGLILWDFATRKRLAEDPLLVRGGIVRSVVFSPDSKKIAAGYGWVAAIWDIDLDSWQHLAAQVANRNFTWDEWRQYFPDESYRRTFRDLPWPSKLPETERKQAEQKEKEQPPDSLSKLPVKGSNE
jgi:WD40 repeat protein